MNEVPIREVVKEKYGKAALVVLQGGGSASCCGDDGASCGDPITKDLYSAVEAATIPKDAIAASLGCGSPTALIELRPGETVLDLGSGGGVDVLLSAKRVGPAGKAYGLDMTDEMLALANQNKAAAGATNVEFLRGAIEQIPLPDASVDVVISNCVINLSSDKSQTLREAFRVLRPGGRFAVSDVVLKGELPETVKKSVESWTGCIAGALTVDEYQTKLKAAGFEAIGVQPTRSYTAADAETSGGTCGCGPEGAAGLDSVMSAFIRATKPRDNPLPVIA